MKKPAGKRTPATTEAPATTGTLTKLPAYFWLLIIPDPTTETADDTVPATAVGNPGDIPPHVRAVVGLAAPDGPGVRCSDPFVSQEDAVTWIEGTQGKAFKGEGNFAHLMKVSAQTPAAT